MTLIMNATKNRKHMKGSKTTSTANNTAKTKTGAKGFTLIELSLSVAILGVLSLTIALIINDSIATYRRGLTLNQVNTVGMDLVDDMRTAFQNSSAKSVMSECESLYEKSGESGEDDSSSRTACKNDQGKNLVSVTKYANVTVNRNAEEQLVGVPVYGAICTGSYSYIWNSGYFFDSRHYEVINTSPATFKLGDDEYKDFRLLKVLDRNRGVCAYSMLASISGNLKNAEMVYTKGAITRSDGVFINSPNEIITEDQKPISLLAEDNNDTTLALYDLQSAAPIQSNANNRLFYSVSFILGTIDGGVNIMSSGNFCATPDDYKDANFNYCAINKFNFAVQATGE